MHAQVKCKGIFISSTFSRVQLNCRKAIKQPLCKYLIKQPYQLHVVNSSCGIKDFLLAYTTANAITAYAGDQTKVCGESIGVSRKGYPCDGRGSKYEK